MQTNEITEDALNQLFRDARSHDAWRDEPVAADVLRRIFDLTKMGPTSANCLPARFVFVSTPAGKARLKPCLAPVNIAKCMAAPVVAIIAHDIQFYDHLPRLFPHADARAWFAGNDPLIDVTAFRNGTLQGAYFMLAARALGLDCGPMSGFDNAKLDDVFFPDGRFKSNFICAIGRGDPSVLPDRSPRFDFEDVCTIV